MSKQTAVEWLIENLEQQSGSYRGFINIQTTHEKLIEQAKAMEKEQIELAFDEGLEYEYEHHINGYPRIEPSTYYNETYGGDK